jgi:hypothetical protein
MTDQHDPMAFLLTNVRQISTLSCTLCSWTRSLNWQVGRETVADAVERAGYHFATHYRQHHLLREQGEKHGSDPFSPSAAAESSA